MELAIVENNICINRIKVPDGWTGAKGEWQPPAGSEVVADPEIVIGAERNGGNWAMPAETAAEQAERILAELQRMSAISTVLLVRLIERLLANGTLSAQDLDAVTPKAKAGYQEMKALADILDPA